jgi:aspartokinase/homoserine dehydrogenase 1
MSTDWIVHKFGGTSLADADRYRGAADLVRADGAPGRMVVVSAMAGVTDALIGLVHDASARRETYLEGLEQLRRKQIDAIEALLPSERRDALVSVVERDVADIKDVLRALWLMQSPPRNAMDLVSGYGELWSARLLATHLASTASDVEWLDAREVLVVESGDITSVVDWDESRRRLAAWREKHPAATVVVTGFVASTREGVPTTLGRNGSDYSASIFAALLDALEIDIWTDVDGVLSADPRQVPEAVALSELSYDEAMELAYFGAKVIHPSTMTPAVDRKIPIFIRNTFHPDLPGTRIHLGTADDAAVKGFATVDDMTLLNLEGTGMIGVPGIAERLFGALREACCSVVMISQGSSEHSICLAVPGAQGDVARAAIERAFDLERRHGQIQSLDVTDGCTILAVVGDNMAGIPGVAGSFFGALGKASVNVRAIAQGSSERNISVVIDGKDATRALRAVHAGFYLSKQALSIGVIGPGVVGSTLLDQLAGEQSRLREELNVDLRIRGIATSSRMVLDDKEIPAGGWRQAMESSSEPVDLDRFADHVQTESIPHAVLIDCTASDEIAMRYADWMERGIHVITPNKKASTADRAYHERLRQAGRRMKMHYLYETTVGAALPILQTLRDLIQTGDEILEIEGIFSGTLSYLFNSFDGSRPFSEIVREARDKGYTEPDPREDLSGMDVARKVVILAREMGMDVELRDASVESLVPDELVDGSVDEFLNNMGSLDDRLRELVAAARSRDEVLRFVGTIDPKRGLSVRLSSYPATHPFGRIQLTDNIVQFRTRRYSDNPLVVQGPGAGPDVTAGGVFADLLRLASYLGATLV